MKILVTGAGGMLGCDVVKTAQAAGHTVVAFDRSQLDITNPSAVNTAVASVKPDVVINCAAYTNVDGAESDQETALLINGTAAGYLAKAACDNGSAIIQVSTDYVFDGSKGSAYIESDYTNPQSVYGSTKLVGEEAVARLNQRHIVVRTSWLFGLDGHNFVETMLKLGAAQTSIQVVTDQIGSPTYTAHLAKALVEMAEKTTEAGQTVRNGNANASIYGIHHVAADGHCSWNGFASEIMRQQGIDCTVEKITTEQMPRPAKRPAYSVLVSERPNSFQLPSWQDGLSEYLLARNAALKEQALEDQPQEMEE